MKIVVGVDGSPPSVQALRWADLQARLTGGELHAVIAWHPPVAFGYAPDYSGVDWAENARSVLGDAIDKALDEDDRTRVHRHVVEGQPALTLLEAAAEADLLVVGSRGHGGFSGLLLGSVSQHVITHAACPVVVMPAATRD